MACKWTVMATSPLIQCISNIVENIRMIHINNNTYIIIWIYFRTKTTFRFIEAILHYDDSVPANIPRVKGRLTIQKVISEQVAVIWWREVWRFYAKPDVCHCYSPANFCIQTESLLSTSAKCLQELNGKGVLVRYDSKSFVGQVTQVLGKQKRAWFTKITNKADLS